ncbi:MAG: peptide/nickel transport system ATP-binding protein [Thermotogaceae bacterium]|nr:peptide/nickel transport system ATP-binding protein [Thermotogaceae bacterium]
MKQETPLLKVENLLKEFSVVKGFWAKKARIKAVNNISFSIDEGEAVGLVGESGCGKTTTGRMLVKLLEPTAGKIFFSGEDISNLKGSKLKTIRREIQMVFQDPFSSLNPRMTVYDILKRPLEIFKVAKGSDEKKQIALEILQDVGLKPEHLTRYPHEFSGGQRQRIAIARALILKPRFIVLDEPTSALDVSVQAQILNLLKNLRKEHSLTYLLISHDLSVVRFLANRIMVMYMGKLVEVASTSELFREPLHPYTRLLMGSIPNPNPRHRKKLKMIEGDIPSLLNPPPGCFFAPRCPLKTSECDKAFPELREVKEGHLAACFKI